MESIIKVEHLKKYYKDVKAVDDISFKVEKGELFGFLGVNGAGKSTTINILCTIFEPTEGLAEVNGLKLGKDNEEIKRHIGVVYQTNCLDKRLTVRDNLMLRGALYETKRESLTKNLDNVCEILELTDVMKRPCGKLSGGQKRRCEIARALMHTPDILFLDEPTTGLDPATRKSVWSTITKLQRELDMTVFLTTHYMEEAARANHIAIIDSGHIVQYGTPFSLKEAFAKDKLRIFPKENMLAPIQDILDRQGALYKIKEEKITIAIDSTILSLPLLESCKDMIKGFEVIQGTMDDVFLNASKGDRAYV